VHRLELRPQKCPPSAHILGEVGTVDRSAATSAAATGKESLMNDTTLTIVGNVVDAPERKVLDNGASVTTFRVASTSRRFDREQSSWIDRDTLFVRVTCWRQLGDNASRCLIKGDPVVVVGRYFSRRYEVEEQKRTAYDLEASAIGHDLARGTSTFQRNPRSADAQPAYEVDEPAPAAA